MLKSKNRGKGCHNGLDVAIVEELGKIVLE